MSLLRDILDFAATLTRPGEGRLLLGVCAGLSEGLGLDVTLIRLCFLVLLLASGLGLVLYLALGLLLPGEDGQRLSLREPGLGLRRLGQDLGAGFGHLTRTWDRDDRSPSWLPVDRRAVALILVASGTLILMQSLGLFAWLGPVRALALTAILLGAGLLISLKPRPRR